MNKHIYILFFLAVSLYSCADKALVNSFHEIPKDGWQYETIVEDTFVVTQPNYYHTISANLRISTDYPYANIHLKVDITDPTGETKSYKTPIELAEKSGKWLGSGLGDIITFQVPILHRKVLDKKGKYTITIAQDMRLETLPSIHAAGIRIEQEEEIF